MHCTALEIINDSETYLFPEGDTYTPIKANLIRNYYRVIRKNAGINNTLVSKNGRGSCFHCFRHTFAVSSFDKNERRGINQRESVPFLSTYFGHDSLYETEKYLRYSGDYFETYLPYSRGLSMNTINSYKQSFLLLIRFMLEIKSIVANDISFADLTYETLSEFFSWLETDRRWNRIKEGFSDLHKAIIVIRLGDVICLTPFVYGHAIWTIPAFLNHCNPFTNATAACYL